MYHLTRLGAVLLLAVTVAAQEPAPKPAKPKLPGVGDALPTFRVNDHTGSAVAIGGKSTKWTVIAFYPKASTPG